MFRVSPQEMAFMKSQFVISSLQTTENERNNVVPQDKRKTSAMPFAFTEQGVAMLSSVLRSETAVPVNIAIMRAFVMARQILTETREKLSNYLIDISKYVIYRIYGFRCRFSINR